MKKALKLIAIIALAAVIGFSFAACDDGGDGGDPLANQVNGTWKAGNGEEITLNNGSFTKSQNNKQSMRGTYTATATRSISANLTMAVNELHGDYLTEVEEGPTFENKWYTKNQVTDAFRKWMKDENPTLTDAQINVFLAGQSANIDALFPTRTAEIDGDTMTLDGTTYTKNGGGTPVNPGAMTWTKVTNSPFNLRTIYGIAYGNNTFVAVGSYGNNSDNNRIATSSDNGLTWTAVTTNAFDYTDPGGYLKTDTSIFAIAFGNGTFVAGGGSGRMAYSSDGVNWTAAITPEPVVESSLFLSQIEAIAYGNGTFVVASNNGQMAYSSDNGVTWTMVANNPYAYAYGIANAIAYGNNTFVAVGNNGEMAYSSDNGVTWTAVDTGTIFEFTRTGYTYIADIRAIAYGNSKFVAVGKHGKMATSTDGRTWTAVTDSTFGTGDIYTIAYGNGRFVAGGQGGMATSTNGTTWTSVDTKTNQSGAVEAVAFGNDRFVAGYTLGGIDYSTGGGNSSSNNPQTATYTGTSGSTAYTLKITENTARYTAKNGDAYELTAGAKKSTGTVNNVSGGVLTLKPSNAATTFTASVSGSSLTALNGTITWTDKTTAAGPGTFTTGSNPGTGSGGTVTITDIPAKYNGKYATFVAANNAGADTTVSIVGYQSVSGTLGTSSFANTTFPRIANGSVSIPAWLRNADNTLVRYSGNDTFDIFGISIQEGGTAGEAAAKGTSNLLVACQFSSVTFSNGSAARSRNNATRWIEYVNGTPQN